MHMMHGYTLHVPMNECSANQEKSIKKLEIALKDVASEESVDIRP